MQIQKTSGKVTGLGKMVQDNSSDLFDYVELKAQDGGFTKLYNVTVGPECRRALKPGDDVTLLHCYTPDVKSKAFPNNSGISFVYAAASKQQERVFDDVNQMAADGEKLRSLSTKVMVFVWGLVIFILGAWMIGRAPIGLALFGLIVPAGLYFASAVPVKKMAAMCANQQEIEPHLAQLRTSGLAEL
ncbi:hypothetical protein ABIC83_002383 [Roseateles asaccharophilus]|uniref:hypothetical protein n=1 Tax=Roseateles asaccharophilus TaxID=582607 RepID=UPI0038324874